MQNTMPDKLLEQSINVLTAKITDSKMSHHEFTLILESSHHLNEGLEDMLFEAGCDDATLSFRNGIPYLDFDREADTLESAILSAIHQVEQSGEELSVKRVEPSDLVTSAEIARRTGRSRQSVGQLITGTRGEADFPLPVAGVTTKTMLWSWLEVVNWLFEKDKLTDKTIIKSAVTLKLLNDSLDIRRDKLHLKGINRITKLLVKRREELV